MQRLSRNQLHTEFNAWLESKKFIVDNTNWLYSYCRIGNSRSIRYYSKRGNECEIILSLYIMGGHAEYHVCNSLEKLQKIVDNNQ